MEPDEQQSRHAEVIDDDEDSPVIRDQAIRQQGGDNPDLPPEPEYVPV